MKKITTKKLKRVVEKLAPDLKNNIVADSIADSDLYSVSIKVFGRMYEAIGATLKEAIENLKVGKVGGVCVMIVTHGDFNKEKILNAGQLFRLFSSSRIMHEMALKNVLNIFDNI